VRTWGELDASADQIPGKVRGVGLVLFGTTAPQDVTAEAGRACYGSVFDGSHRRGRLTPSRTSPHTSIHTSLGERFRTTRRTHSVATHAEGRPRPVLLRR
jgi:hypothetical protein